MIDPNSLDLAKFRNRARVVRAYGRGTPVNPARPVELILEITDHCNLACIMCPRPNMTRELGHMDFDLYCRIIDQVKDDIELVYLSGGLGEPLMHPDLSRMIRYAREANVRLGISTNASLMARRVADMLLDARPSLILLSLDGATKATHEKIRVGSRFEKTMANVEYFLTEKARRGLADPYTIVQMVYMPENQAEADLFRETWRRFEAVDDIRLKRFLALDGADRQPDVDAGAPDHDRRSCILPWRQLSIAWDGTLALCCRDLNFRESMGSVRTHTIDELWNSEKMVRYRAMLAGGRKSEIALCAGCPTVQTTRLTRLGSVLFDDFTIRKLLPIVEKVALRTGLKIVDYS